MKLKVGIERANCGYAAHLQFFLRGLSPKATASTASVNLDDVACHMGCSIAAEKQDEAGNVGWLADPTSRLSSEKLVHMFTESKGGHPGREQPPSQNCQVHWQPQRMGTVGTSLARPTGRHS